MYNDKLKHLVAGLVIGAATCSIFGFYAGVGVAALAGAAKEAWDHQNPPHVVDLFDFLATVAGGIIGSLAVYGVTKWH